MNSRRQHGLALITAVFIVAIVTTIAAYLALGQQVWLRQAQSFFDRGQAGKVADGALQWAMLMLEDDAKNNNTNKYDEPGEDWAQPLPAMPVEGGAVGGRIRDAQGYFNLNNLIPGGNNTQHDVLLFARLLTNLRLDPALANAVIDWIDPGGDAGAGGAEDTYYLTLQPPYRAANQPLTSVDELRLVRGFTPEVLKVLRPHVTVLPDTAPVNINFCSAEVLAALFENFTVDQAKALIEQRDGSGAGSSGSPFKDKNDLKTLAGVDPAPDAPYDVRSDYFVVDLTTRFGRLTERRETLVRRQQGKTSVIWKTRSLMIPAAGDDEGEDEIERESAARAPRGPTG
ncbi:MAG TPA: type II secretion system minor pseudopilin GspK [Acidiferrobacterales bacterium]|jgi:general secretion pathway protein K